MEGHQITWNPNVPYEDLVKQCPFLSQRASLPLEKPLGDDIKVPEVQISKSKKKRLKKRLKAISQSNKTTSDELNPSSEANQTDMASNDNKASLSDKKTGKASRVSDVVDGEINVVHPKLIGESVLSEKDKKNKTKQNRKESTKVDSKPPSAKIIPTSSESLNPTEVVKVRHEVAQTKKQVAGDAVKDKNSLGDSQNRVADNEKSREEILSEREAKKKAKQLAKQKKIEKSQVVSSEKSSLETNKKSDVLPVNIQEQVSLGISQNKPVEIEGKPKEDVLTQIKTGDSNTKSRDEVLEEREAKKKAKQLAKLKKLDKGQEAPSQKHQDTAQISDPIGNNDIDIKMDLSTNDKSGENKSDQKSKSQLKAERRAKQEAQRAAKEAEKKLKLTSVENKENQVVKPVITPDLSKEPKASSKSKTVSQQRIKLFSHLHLGQRPSQTQLIPNVHPSVIELGIKYSSQIINGSNARCVALLNCLKEVIDDYSTPAEKEFSRGLESKLGELTNYLNQFRPFAVSMTNALRHIKSHLTQLPNNVSDDEAKRKLFDVIDTFIREQIDVAGEAICESVKNKITNGDVILIYSCSSLLYRILTESYRSGREFSVIVVDGGPWFEGREMLRRLVEAGLKCSYVQISALSFIVRQATKVLLGAHALLANGCVMSRAGSALVALAAHACGVPVLVCCETYKFCERVQTDAYVYNELGSPDDLVKEDSRLNGWKSLTFLTPLSIVYDITPPDLVTAVVTEIAILPCTSVPVILRVKPSDVVS